MKNEYVKKMLHSGFSKVFIDISGKEVVEVPDCVAVLVYLRDRDSVVLVKQERTALREKISSGTPLLVEVPAGLFDTKIGVKELIVKELWEEIKASVTIEQVNLLNNGQPVAAAPGILTSCAYLAYVIIEQNQLKDGTIFGLEEEGEKIERIIMPADEFISMTHHDMKTLLLSKYVSFIQFFCKNKML